MMSGNGNEFDINEHDFPTLCDKPNSRVFSPHKGRRVALDAKSMKEATLQKTVVDEANILGKRRKARLLSECDSLAPDVIYSLNRKNRWQTVHADALLADAASMAENRNVEVAVVDGVRARKGGPLAKALHTLNADWSVSSIRSKNIGKAACLFAEQRKRSSSEAEKEEGEGERPMVVYTISRPHPNARIAAAREATKSLRKRTSRRAGAFLVEDDDMVGLNEVVTSMHEEGLSSEYRRSREASFCLGDYITATKKEKADGLVKVEAPSEESVIELDASDIEEDTSRKPFQLLDTRAVGLVEEIFDCIPINITNWKDFDFDEQVKNLSTTLPVRWLDATHQRATIDITSKFPYKSINYMHSKFAGSCPLAIIVFERTSDPQQINMVINASASYACKIPFNNWWKAASLDSLEKLVDEVASRLDVDRFGLWNFYEKMVKDFNPKPSLILPEMELQHREIVNSSFFSTNGHAYMYPSTTEMIARAEIGLNGELSEHFESFLDKEIIDARTTLEHPVNFEVEEEDDDFDIVHKLQVEQSETQQKPAVVTVACKGCDQQKREELFEMGDCWMCRDCLRRAVVSAIKHREIPLTIDLVLPEEMGMEGKVHQLAPVHALPAILPLPSIYFYLYYTSKELHKWLCEPNLHQRVCPHCFTLLQYSRPDKTDLECECLSLICGNCASQFCCECNGEPHWPLSCDEMQKWQPKFQLQYKHELLRDDIKHRVKQITCICGAEFEVGDNCKHTRCPGCNIEMIPCDMDRVRILKDNIAKMNKYDREMVTRKLNAFVEKGKYSMADTSIPGVTTKCVEPVRLIRRPYAHVAALARQERLNVEKTKNFERQIHKTFKGDDKLIRLLPQQRKAALHLLEYGSAAAYLRHINKTPLGSVRLALDALDAELFDDSRDVNVTRRLDCVAALMTALEQNMEFFCL